MDLFCWVLSIFPSVTFKVYCIPEPVQVVRSKCPPVVTRFTAMLWNVSGVPGLHTSGAFAGAMK